MTFSPPTLDETHAFLIALTRALQPEIDVSEMTDEWLWTKTQAAGVTGNHAHLRAVLNDLLPDTSEGDILRRWAAIRGVVPKTATPARKADALRVVGTPTTTVPDGSEIVHDVSGLRFKTSGTNIVGPGGYVDCDVIAIDVGSQTRLSKGERLTFGTPIVNIQEDAELQLALDEDGTDQESDGALRRRVLARFSSPPLGGSAEDYVQWALEVTGYADAYAYPLRAGLGTVDLAALHEGSGSVRAPTAPEVAALQALLDVKRPVSVKGFRVLNVTAEEVDVEVTVLPDGEPEHEFDWDDTTPGTVLAWTGATRLLQFTGGARPTTLKAGDRIVIKKLAGVGTGKERVVESLSGADSVVLEADATGDAPAATETVYAGGALVQLVRDSIQALFGSLGTANPDTNRYGAWEGSLRPTKLSGAAGDVDGVLEAVVVIPLAKTDASDPLYPQDGSVGLLVAGRILVRRAH
ncbi:MAG: baseplate J/gp47 family protein [Myxococcota bacterium]|nr:baseplate J/gp47 family protein [Myxococcota bacterium]